MDKVSFLYVSGKTKMYPDRWYLYFNGLKVNFYILYRFLMNKHNEYLVCEEEMEIHRTYIAAYETLEEAKYQTIHIALGTIV